MGKLGTTTHSVEIDGKHITFEGGKLAAQAGGAVVASLGETTILTTTTSSSQTKEFLGFFPLTIDVEERMYAAGKIPGGFFKREGRPSENAILTCRLTDRPLRPTFEDGLRNEIQVVNTILQTTQTDPYDVLAINASSVSTMLAGVPFHGPVAALRYAMLRDGSWEAFPNYETLENEAVFNMVVAGRVTDGGEVAILMVEADATENAWRMIEMGATKPTEEVIGQALEDLKPILKQLCEAQQAFVDEMGVRETAEFTRFLDYTDEVFEVVDAFANDGVAGIYDQHGLTKDERSEKLGQLRDESVAHAVEKGVADLDTEALTKQAKEAFRSVEKKIVRKMISEKGVRIDGRAPTDIRSLEAEIDLLPRTHGSGWFRRGETNVLTVLALGSMRAAQRLDTLSPEEEKRYLHHYNFPPFSVGETGRIGSPKRREIGHGALAERALLPVIPDEDSWPYTIRLVSEVTSSNGSTSMASVCGSTLALMDGGVPIHAPVAGIAMGLIKEGDTFTTLTDIQGTEDFYGDMDFKVAGTAEFVTALQLDTKLTGIPSDVLGSALLQAKDARMQILEVMLGAIDEPRAEVKDGAPRVINLTIPRDKVGEVIGPKGKVIREITEETGAEIDVDDDGRVGTVRIYADNNAAAAAAEQRINAIANPTIPEAGERYHATVVKTVDFGAFVNLTPGIDGLVHISKLSKIVGKRLDHGEEAVNVGDKLWVEVLEVLDGGRKFKLDLVEGGEGDRGAGDREEPAGSDRDQQPDTPAAERSSDDDAQDAGRSDDDDAKDAGRSDDDDGARRERKRTRTRSRD
ncbi:MAG: polyribonucleotide nucleotidyltransferase [Actinobacteria bacterium]|nr:polyribonucleotide nucleotidyltransferase [Actinomycetota bacterium]